MKITTTIKTAVAVGAMASAAAIAAPIAFAGYPIAGKLGSELTMTDSVGQVVLSWKVSDLKSSTDTIPGYPVAGQVWEATATVNAIRGAVTPPSRNSMHVPTAASITECCGKPRPWTASAGPPSRRVPSRAAKSTSMSPVQRRPSLR